jgi:hypothetical protein
MTGVHTVSELQRSRRRLDRRRGAAGLIVTAMQRGARLHLQYACGRALWRLSGGSFVPTDVAAVVISHPCVVSVGDALFPDTPAQTWRFVELKGDSR